MSKLHIIDFSDGIRSEEIQENFEILNDEISRERLSIGGAGIASGLEIEPIVNDLQFAIKVSAASIVDKNGDEIYIKEQVINIERPRLSKQLEYLTADVNNQVVLKEIPYALDRMKPVQYDDSISKEYSGIEIKYQNSSSTDDYIRPKIIKGKVLSLSGLTRRQVAVSYYSTAKRIDVVYVDENNNISVKSSSITSTTPSVVMPEKYNYLIAFIQIEPEYIKDSNDTPHANISIKKDLRTSRNLYTDKNGTLYICGTPFDDLHLITTEEPIDPKPNQLWLHDSTLYVYQAVDSYTYKRSLEMASSSEEEGYRDFETNIDFCINKKQLKVYVNSRQLQESEYEELFGMLPVSIQTIPENTYSNMFRIYTALNAGDIVTYTITFNESGYRWIPINKESYINVKETKTFGKNRLTGENYWTSPQALSLGVAEDLYPNKFKYFIFDATVDRNVFFTPGRNEVEVLINQTPLHKDQFVEIDLNMVLNLPPDVQKAISDMFGWDGGRLSTLSDLYDDVGIGIMLEEPLDAIFGEGLTDADNKEIIEEQLYVEININRAVSNVSTTRKLQRSAVYVYEDNIVVENSAVKDYETLEPYRYKENQLEIFLNGVKLAKDIDFKEGADLEEPFIKEDGSEYTGYYDKELSTSLRMRGQMSKLFTMVKPIVPGDVITYKITSNFYSYDHINSLLDNIETNQEECNAKVTTLYENTLEFCQNTEVAISELKDQMAVFSGNNSGRLDTYLTRDSVIEESQLDGSVARRIPQSTDHICEVLTFGTYDAMGIDVTYCVRAEDFLMIWWRDMGNSQIDRMLIPNEDYTLHETRNADGMVKAVHLRLTESALSNIKTNDKLILRGIKFGRDGR